MNRSESESRLRDRQRFALAETGLTVRSELAHDLSDDEFAGIVELLRQAFNGGPGWFLWGATPVDHLMWKAADRPGDALIHLTEVGERIIGFGLRTSCRFLIDGSEMSVEQWFDSALDPEFQGRGIDSARRKPTNRPRLNTNSCMSVDLGMHPTSRARRGTSEGIAFGNALDTLVKPLSIKRLITTRARRQSDGAVGQSRTRDVLDSQQRRLPTTLSPERLLLALRLGWSVLRPAKRETRKPPWQIRTIEHFSESADEFWSRAAEAFDFIQVRDRTYLNWRYCDPRGGAFTVRVAELDGALLGYAALRADERGAVLGDLLVLPDRSDVARALVADAVALASERQSPLLRCWMPRTHPYRDLLSDSGFVQYRTPMTFSYRPRECDPAALEFLQDPRARIHFMTADTDHV